MKRFLKAFSFITLLLVGIDIFAQNDIADKIDSMKFPRLVKLYLGTLDSSNIPLIAQYPLVIITSNAASKIDEIRTLNPDIIIIQFTNPKIRSRSDLMHYPVFPNWIVYTAGSLLTDSISGDISDTVIFVSDAKKFRPPSTNDTDHVLRQVIRIDNEFMEISEVDTTANSLTVSRFDTILSPHVSGARVRSLVSRWPNIFDMNISTKCPVNGSNKQFADYTLNMLFNATLNAKDSDSDYVFDGALFDMFADVFSDVSATFTVQDGSQDIDLDMDGTADVPDSLNSWWSQGMRDFVQKVKDTLAITGRPDFLLLCNDQAELYDLLNGRFFEAFPFNPTSGCSIFGGWKATMQLYGQWMDTTAMSSPRLSYIDGGRRYGVDSLNYDYHRLVLASCLMNDAFYTFDNGDKDHDSFWWYDEYAVDTTGTSVTDTAFMEWLGYPEGSALQVYADTTPGYGIWIRKFQQGMALLAYLPKNDSVHVTLDTMYYRIQGVSNTSFNNGDGPFSEIDVIASPAVGISFENGDVVGVGALFYKKKSVTTSVHNEYPADKSDIIVTPNPASETVTVELISFSKEKSVFLEIYTIDGFLLKKIKCEEQITAIDISDLAQGIYIIKSFNGKKAHSQKFEIIR